MEHFNHKTDTKEGTDGQKLKKIQMDCDVRLSSFNKILKSQGPGEYLFAMKLLFCHFDHWRQMLPKISFTEYLVKLNNIDLPRP